MEAGLGWLLDRPRLGERKDRPSLVLLAGFSGGLQPGLTVGELILATEVADTGGYVWPATWPKEPHPTLRRGRVLTTPHLIAAVDQKRHLGQEHQALAVDMESATAARWCRQRGIPFGCLRVISDDDQTPLSPDLVQLLRDGRVSISRLLAALLRRPGLVGELWRLGQQTRRAAQNLARGLGELLPHGPPA